MLSEKYGLYKISIVSLSLVSDIDNDEDDAPNEASSFGHAVNMYQCSQAMIRTKGAPITVLEVQEKMRLLLRKVDPPAAPKQKTQGKSKKMVLDKSMSMRNKLRNTPLDNTNISLTLGTSVSLPPLDYSIVDYMKKTHENINLFELSKI